MNMANRVEALIADKGFDVNVTSRGGWFQVETFKDNQLFFRHRSFEPDFYDQMKSVYGIDVEMPEADKERAVMIGEYKASPVGIVNNAIRLNWTAEQLSWSFYGMTPEVAQDLLDRKLTITNDGVLYPSGHQE